jgi:multidrug efflux pump subunit AcrA (membrane-fusion protein)
VIVKKTIVQFLQTALLVAFAPSILCACSKSESNPMGPMPVSVKVQVARSGIITDASNYTGTVVSRQSVTLSPQIDGHVTKLFVAAGALVKLNQPLLEISPDKQAASVQSFEAILESNKDDLQTAKHNLRVYEATKSAKTSALHLAEADRDRYTILRQNGAVSQQELEQRLNTLEGAKADLLGAESQIEAQRAVVKRIEKIIGQSGANIKEQNVQLQYYTIRAPFEGTVGDIPIKIGDYVNTTTRLTTVTKNRPLEIYVAIPIEHAKQLKLNMPIELQDSAGQSIGTSQVFFIAPNVISDSQTVLVKSRFANDKDLLRADQTVHARVIWEKKTGVLVPTESVSHQSGQDFVFVAQTDKGKTIARQLPISLGAIEDTQYQVLKGLKVGEKVITSGVQNLSDGAQIAPTI